MTFTILESMLLAAFVSCIAGITVRTRSVSPRECAGIQDRLVQAIEGLKKSNDIQFRMLRELVARSDLPPEVKANILNMK